MARALRRSSVRLFLLRAYAFQNSECPATRQWRVEEGDPRLQRNDMYLAELQHFAASVRGDIERPLIDGEQGAAILAIALAGLRSSAGAAAIDLHAQGEPVTTWLSSLGRP